MLTNIWEVVVNPFLYFIYFTMDVIAFIFLLFFLDFIYPELYLLLLYVFFILIKWDVGTFINYISHEPLLSLLIGWMMLWEVRGWKRVAFPADLMNRSRGLQNPHLFNPLLQHWYFSKEDLIKVCITIRN